MSYFATTDPALDDLEMCDIELGNGCCLTYITAETLRIKRSAPQEPCEGFWLPRARMQP